MELINNGMHSFKCALESLKDLDENSFKYNGISLDYSLEYNIKDIILRLHHSFEVLFKHMLKEIDEAYIYNKVDDYYEKKFNSILNEYSRSTDTEKAKKETNGLKTINYTQAFKRVVIYYNIKLNKSTANSVIRLNDLRNNLTHTSINFKFDEIKGILANIIIDVIPILEKIERFKKYVDSNNIGEYINELKFFRNELIFESLEKLILRKELTYFEKKDEFKIVITEEDFKFINNVNSEYLDFIVYIKDFSNKEKYITISNTYYSIDKLNEQIISLIMDKIEDVFYRVDKEYISSKYNNNKKYYDKIFVLNICKYLDDIARYINCYNFKESTFLNDIKGQDLLTKIKIGCKLHDLDCFISNILNSIIGKNNTKNILNEDGIDQLIKEVKKILSEENIFLYNQYMFNNVINNELDDEIQDYVNCNIHDEVWSCMCESGLAGSWNGNGTIDNIEEIYGEDIKAIVVNDNSTYMIFKEISVSTSYYFDGDYYPNEGSIALYVCIYVQDNNIVDCKIYRFD